jgi:predicted SprT family Zn-dependent metalloprotease
MEKINFEKIIKVEILAKRLMAEHGLRDWKFAWIKKIHTLGQCYCAMKTIKLSIPYVLVNDIENITDTILHEIAHALVGGKHGHNFVWKLKAKEIGCLPQRLASSKTITPYKWYYVCVKCDKKFGRIRRVTGTASCPYCHDQLKLEPAKYGN